MTKKINEDNNTSNAVNCFDYDDLIMSSAVSDKAYEARNNARLAWYEAGKPRPKKNY